MLGGENAFLLEQLGFGHTSTNQMSSCTWGVVYSYFANSTVGVLPDALRAGCAHSLLIGFYTIF